MAIFTELFDSFGRVIRPFLGKYGTDDYREVVVDTDGQLIMGAGAAVIGRFGHDITGILHGVETVDSAGTDQAIVTSSTPAKGVIVQAQTDNTNVIAVGGSGVDATIATGTGTILYAGDSEYLPCTNLNQVYIDALVSGEGVRFTYFT